MQISQRKNMSSLVFVLLTYAFLYLPLIVLVLFSFNKAQFPAPFGSITFMWYYELWHDTALLQACLNSFIIATSATFLSVLFAVMLVFSAVKGKRTKELFQLFYGNLIIPEVVLAVGLLSLFVVLQIPLGFTSLIIAHTVLGLGYAVPLVYTRLQSLDDRLIEASLDLGATRNQTFFKIILPLLWPALLASALLVFILSFDDFVLSYFCAASGVQTISLYIFSLLRSGISPVVNALSTVLLVMSCILVFIFCSLQNRAQMVEEHNDLL